MKKVFSVFFCLAVFSAILFNFGCGSKNNKNDITTYYHMDKKYWDAVDYDDVINKIKDNTTEEQKPLNLSDPEKAPVFRKLVDKENIAIVANDNTLGLLHRETFVDTMVDCSRSILEIYSGIDREDKYNFPDEYVLAWRFYLWADYYDIKIINEKMKKESDATNASEVGGQCAENMNSIIHNYTVYLDLANKESSFTADALKLYAEGIDECFPKIISDFSDGDYSIMLEKVNALLEKISSPVVKESLENIKTKIDSMLEQKKADLEKKKAEAEKK